MIESRQRLVWRMPSGFGSLNNLRLECDELISPIQDDEVVVKVNAIGLNFADIFTVLGLYSAATQEAAVNNQQKYFVPGLEFAGVVLEAGRAANFKIGDRVYGFRRFGAFASVVIQRDVYLRHTPEYWTDSEAAAFPVQALTAWYSLCELANCQKGSRVLVHSAAGGVGLAALTICQSLGAIAVGVVGNEEKVAVCKSAKRVIVRRKIPDAQYLAELDDSGPFDIVLDSLGAGFFHAAFDRLEQQGRLIHFGATASYGSARSGILKWPQLIWAYITRPKIDPGILTSTNRGVLGFNLIWLCNQHLAMNNCLDNLLQALTSLGADQKNPKIPPAHVGRTFSFKQLPDALRFFQGGKSVGKVVVLINDDELMMQSIIL